MSKSKISPESRGLLVILGAPSGTGKSTVLRRLMADDSRLAFSVSHTTRPPRPGEVDGVAYQFVDGDRFAALVSEGAFAEHAQVHARRYGTSRAEIDRLWAAGHDVLFDVDVQGANQLRVGYPEALSVFMLPPSLAKLEERLRGRGTESDDQIRIRLDAARGELEQAPRYRYAIVNRRVKDAALDFAAILAVERALRGIGAPPTDAQTERATACQIDHRTALLADLLSPAHDRP